MRVLVGRERSNTGGKKRGQKATFVNISQKDSPKTFSGIAKAMSKQDFINWIKRAYHHLAMAEQWG